DARRRHERADQKPRPDVKKLRVLAHRFLDVDDRVGDLDGAVLARAETELIHGLDPSARSAVVLEISGSQVTRSVVEQCDAAGPAGGRLLDLHRKAAHLESKGRQRFEIGQLLHVTVTNVAAGLVAFPNQARIAGLEKALGGE